MHIGSLDETRRIFGVASLSPHIRSTRSTNAAIQLPSTFVMKNGCANSVTQHSATSRFCLVDSWDTSYELLQRPMAVCEAVYYVAHHFGVAGEGVSTPQKDSMHDRGGVSSPALVELGNVTGSATLLQIGRHWSEAGIHGYWKITKIQGMSGGNFLEGKLLRPWADWWISALLAAYDQAPSQSLPLASAPIETLRGDRLVLREMTQAGLQSIARPLLVAYGLPR